MANKVITKSLFKTMIQNGAINLKNNYQEIDNLNVFPVPDGDTGTNMQMTMMNGLKKILEFQDENTNLCDISGVLSRGLVFGARGNSGTILSNFFYGFHKGIEGIKKEEINLLEFIDALKSGTKLAYKTVENPVEGTILTVLKASGDAVYKKRKELKTLEEVMALYVETARKTLANTPNLLPVLKEAGVVDSGGAGFLKIVEGMEMALRGELLIEKENINLSNYKFGSSEHQHQFSEQNIVFGYCTEFIVKLFKPEKFKEEQIKNQLTQFGDSMVIAVVDDLLKVHVHTNQPGIAITLAQKYGDLQTIKVENMRIQHQNLLVKQEETKKVAPKKDASRKVGIIAVCSGEGITEIFKQSGADYIISGGQTMNPATSQFVDAINELNAEHIIIIPNNSNVILAAEQAKTLCPDQDITVIKAKNIAQGYSAIMLYDEFADFENNIETMKQAVQAVGSGEVTYSVRDTQINGLKINKGDYIAIANGQMIASEKIKNDTAKKLFDNLYNTDRELLTIFFGKDITDDELTDLNSYVSEKYPNIELELINGQQEIYSYIIVFE